MKISLWRPAFLSWLQQRIVVNSWELQSPDGYNQSVGFVPPLEQMNYKGSYPELFGYATQPLYLSYRYSRDIRYNDLPISQLEGVYTTLSLYMMTQWSDIAPLESFELAEVESPISFQKPSDDSGDWLIDLNWRASISWLAEPEQGSIRKPITIQQVGVRLYTAKLDFSEAYLDTEFTVPEG